MAVSLNDNWKVPLGYFLINSLLANERASILANCMKIVLNTGAKVYSITFDGAAVNLAMCKHFGANFDIDCKFTPWLNIPGVSNRILVFLDARHMLKLIRNSVAACRIQSTSGIIDWEYFQKLVLFQEKEGFRTGNKLRNRHIDFKDKIMNVKIDVQMFECGTLIVYLRNVVKYDDFQGSVASSDFCENINDAFDILNSKSFVANYVYKRKLDVSSFDKIEQCVHNLIIYLKSLKNFDSKISMYATQKKLGFVGFIVDLTNLLCLFKMLMSETKMKYLLIYKLSQDHLEIFFGAVRSRFGSMPIKDLYANILLVELSMGIA